MDRQVHDYAAASAMAYAQQQRQSPVPNVQPSQPPPPYGYSPQQQFHSSGPPFIPPPHPAMQQFPYPPHGPPHQPPPPYPFPQQQQQQQQQQPPPSFPPHLPPPLVPSPFHSPYDAVPPPSDPELHKRIDKLVEYSAKNGPEFEAMIREKQQDNPEYGFLFGGEGHAYYRYKLWFTTRTQGGSFNPPPFQPSSMHMMRPPMNPMMGPSSLNASPMNASPAMMGAPQMHQPPYFYDQQQHQHPQSFGAYGRTDYNQSSKPFKGLSGPLPPDVAMELNNLLITLNGTKESIKGAKFWFMQRSIFAPALAEALRDRVFTVDDPERQLHIIYLINDIIFDSSHRRTGDELDNEALAFRPVLGSVLARIYHNPQMKEENQLKLQQILQLWASNSIYDQDTINALRNDMMGGGPLKELSTASAESAAGISQQTTNYSGQKWQPDRQGSVSSLPDREHPDIRAVPVQSMPPLVASQPFLPNAMPHVAFGGSMPLPSNVQPPIHQPAPHLLPGPNTNSGEKVPAYPLFPPGLIPGMVRKMQIGSGVPYSPMSPLDIPTVIPPSDVPQSEILERVSKFFKEIGEVNPSEGPLKSDSRDEDDEYGKEYERDSPVRKGGACIPPPPNLQVDPETGAYADGSVDRKSGSGRLGLGATANPNEVSQYDDVYTSYRKQRSTTYHSSMSARAATK